MLTVCVAGGFVGAGISWVGSWADGLGILFEEKSGGLVNLVGILVSNSLC